MKAAESHLYYHITFSPKFRRPILLDKAESLQAVFVKAAKKVEGEIIKMSVQTDHVHLLVSCSPVYAVAHLLGQLKGLSAKECGITWTRSYYIATVGKQAVDRVKSYIDNQ